MEVVEIVNLVLIGIFVLFAFFGFLFGIGRGFSKALLRVLIFIAFALISIAITPYISSLCMSIPLNFGSINGTLTEIITDALNSNAIVQSLISSSEVLADFVAKLPLLILNLVVFVALLFSLSFIGWIVYLILASIFLKKKKLPEAKVEQLHVDFKPKKQKKHRFFGGLVGACHSLIFLALMLVPVTGLLSIIKDVDVSTTANIAYAESVEIKTPTAEIFDQYVPQDVKEILRVYYNSPVAFVSSVTGADRLVFDNLTTIKIEGEETFNLCVREEVYNVARIFDNLEFMVDMDFENLQFSTLNYDKLETAVNTVFSSKLIMTIAPEIINWVVDDLNKPVAERQLEFEIPEEALNIVNMVVNEYESQNGIYQGLKTDLLTVFKVAKSLGESGIIDELMKEEIDIEEIETLALADDRKVIDDVFENLFNAISLRTVAVDLINTQIDNFTASQSTEDPNRIEFSNIDLDHVVWTNVNNDVISIVNNAIDIYLSLSDSFTSNLEDVITNNPVELLNADYNVITTKLGLIMDRLQSFELLVDEDGDKVLYNQFMDYLNNQEFAEYVDFAQFKVENAWITEMANVKDLFVALKESEILSSVIDNIETPENIDVNDILSKLTVEASNNKTYTQNIISPLLNSLALRKMLYKGFDILDGYIEEYQTIFGSSVVLGKIQKQAILDPNERVHILSFFDNVVLYASDLDFEDLQNDAFNVIIDSNLTRLGLALDSIKASALFGEYEEDSVMYDGIYKSLINALSANATYNQFVSFEVALEEDFTWNTELALVQNAIEEMNTITINYGGTDKSLLQAIMDGEDLTQILNVLTEQNVDNLISPLVSSRLFSKNVVKMVNTMNAEIARILSVSITEIPTSANITSQSEEIKLVIKKLLVIYPSITGGITASTLSTKAVEIGELLNAIKVNANRVANDGVFEGTYSAITNFLRNEGTYGEKLDYIMDCYIDENDIDWTKLISLTVDINSIGSTSTISSTLAPRVASIIKDMYQEEIYEDVTLKVIDMFNVFSTIASSTSIDDTMGYVEDALSVLATAQNAYVANNQGLGKTDTELKIEYSQKVDNVLNFFKGLTSITQFDYIIGIEDYEQETNAISQLSVLFDVINGSGVETEDYDAFVDALANSTLMLDMLSENGITAEIPVEFEGYVENYIETNYAGQTDLINTLKAIFGL